LSSYKSPVGVTRGVTDAWNQDGRTSLSESCKHEALNTLFDGCFDPQVLGLEIEGLDEEV
jgi:hypothetical protein